MSDSEERGFREYARANNILTAVTVVVLVVVLVIIARCLTT